MNQELSHSNYYNQNYPGKMLLFIESVVMCVSFKPSPNDTLTLLSSFVLIKWLAIFQCFFVFESGSHYESDWDWNP